MPSMTHLVGVLLMLLTIIETQALQHVEYYTPDSYTVSEALTPLCAGLDRVRIGNPFNCQKFAVCCKSRAFAFVCHLAPTPGYRNYAYSPSIIMGAATYDFAAGLCIPEPTPEYCGHHVLNQVPHDKVCDDVDAIEAIHGPITIDQLRPMSEGARGRNGTGLSPLQEDPQAPSLTSRNLATGNYAPGEFRLIKNPSGRSSTGALGTHAILIPGTDQVLFASRPVARGYEPGMSTNGKGQISSLYNTNSGTYIVQPSLTSPFCMGHTHLADGTVFTAGGDTPGYGAYGSVTLIEGRNVLRTYKPSTGWVNLPVKLAGMHWYPTLLTLPDQRVMIANGQIDPDVTASQQPLVEIYNPATNKLVTASPARHPMFSYKLYPALFLLPWTPTPGAYLLYAFNGCVDAVLMTINKSNVLSLYNTPENAYNAMGQNFCSQTSSGGTGTLLMLSASNGYAAEVVQFGGTKFTNGETCFCNNEAAPFSIRMKLDKDTVTNGKAKWVGERMPSGRTGVDCVVLPNGRVLIVNGAAFGQMQGSPVGGGQSRNAVFNAWLYDPNAPVNGRYTVLAKSPIYRYYHSTALLLPDASVLVAGSEQSNCNSGCPFEVPALVQYQAEKYLPYYYFNAGRPELNAGDNPKTAKMGTTITIKFRGNANNVVLASPAAVTHSLNMNQRVIQIEFRAGPTVGGLKTATVRMPPAGGLVAPQGMYMMFILNNDIPCKKAIWIRLTP